MGTPILYFNAYPGPIDFGDVLSGDFVDGLVTITNIGDANLDIYDIQITGTGAAAYAITDLTPPFSPPIELEPGPPTALTFTIRFTPPSVGTFEATLTVSTNEFTSPDTIGLTGQASAAGKLITLTPNRWDFGDQLVDADSAEKVFTIKSTGTLAVTVDAPTFTAPFQAGTTVPSYPATLNPDDTLDFGIAVHPTSVGYVSNPTGCVVNSDAASDPNNVPLSVYGVEIIPAYPVMVDGDKEKFLVSLRNNTSIDILNQPTVLIGAEGQADYIFTSTYFNRVWNLDTPGVVKSTYAVYFKYEDLGLAQVLVTVSTELESKAVFVTIGTAGAEDPTFPTHGRVRQAVALPVEVEGEIVKVNISTVGGEEPVHPVSIVELFIENDIGQVRKATAPLSEVVIPYASVDPAIVDFIVTLRMINEITLVEDNARNAACDEAYVLLTCPALALSCPIGIAVAGQAYDSFINANGGTAPYLFSVVGGDDLLPEGLVLNELTGEIAGIPTSVGLVSFTLQVTDADGDIATQACSINVQCDGTLTITTTCPLPDGTLGEPYNETLAVTGGQGPYVWSIATGVLPTGLTLHSATGIIDGTPTVENVNNFTLRVTDAYGCTNEEACSITVAALIPLEACGALSFDWALNALVGPFWESSDPAVFTVIGRNPANDKQMQAFVSNDSGVTWAVVDNTFPTLTDTVASFECRQSQDGTFIAVGTQENNTGRVAYHSFDLATKTWSLLDSEVLASVGVVGYMVSVDERSNGDIGVLYATKQTIDMADYARLGFKYSTDGGATWSGEQPVGHWGETQNNFGNRVLAGGAVNTFVFTFNTGGFDANQYVQTFKVDNTLSSIVQYSDWAFGFGMGRPIRYNDGSARLAFPLKANAKGAILRFTDADPAVWTDKTFIGGDLEVAAGSTIAYSVIHAGFINGSISIIAHNAPSGTPVWIFYQSGGVASFTPTDDSLRIGPTLAANVNLSAQEMDGFINTIAGIDFAAVVIGGGFGLDNNGFQLARISQLPMPDQDIDTWIEACGGE